MIKIPVSQASNTSDAPLSVDDARARILNTVTPIQFQERVPLKAALGRVLAESLCSPINVPSFTNSAMDGYALADPGMQRRLRVAGEVFAGKPFQGVLAADECVRIMTGAPVPPGCDRIIMQEQAKRNGQWIEFADPPCAGDHLRRPGEDLKTGETVLTAGKRLRAADLGVLGSIGLSEVAVIRKPRVIFFSTGDELRSAGQVLELGQIYDSNRVLLHAMLLELGIDAHDGGVIPDDPAAIQAAFTSAAQSADAIISSGGVSVGDADYVKRILEQEGEIHFWRVLMKPGKPLAVGRFGKAYFFGLPGNPVSVMATFYQFVQPALLRLMGVRETTGQLIVPARLQTDLRKTPGRYEFQRGSLSRATDGTLEVSSTGGQGSHVLSSMSRADCFILLTPELGDLTQGSWVQVQPFYGLVD